jgi:hypothetical protein
MNNAMKKTCLLFFDTLFLFWQTIYGDENDEILHTPYFGNEGGLFLG